MKKVFVILGFKVQFKDLWSCVGQIEIPSCYCNNRDETMRYCGNCGTDIYTRKVKQYKNRITNIISTHRDTESMYEYLQSKNIDIYEVNPEGYVDDPVYIYLKRPLCKLELTRSNQIKLDILENGNDYYSIKNEIQKNIPESISEKGEYGLWFINEHDIEYEQVLENAERFITLLNRNYPEDK